MTTSTGPQFFAHEVNSCSQITY